MKQDDILEVSIIDYGMDGEGIARNDEFIIFVPFVAVGEKVLVKVNYVKKNLVFATLVTILESNENRVDYPCNRFKKCGGCDILHLKYSEQLKLKRQNLVNLLRKNTHYQGQVDDTVASVRQFDYRNKIQLPFGEVNGKVAVGFYGENSHKIVSITKCFLHGDWAEKLIGIFLNFANENKLSTYNDFTKKGLLRHLVARYIDDKICIVLVINGKNLPNVKKLVPILDTAYGKNYSFYINVNEEDTNVILGKTITKVVENELKINVLGIAFSVNPFSFLQLNNEVRDLIYTRIIDDITKADSPIVIDAYAGVGLIGAVLAKHGVQIYNIEIVKEAIEDAKKLYAENNIADKATQICGDTAVELPLLIDKILNKQSAKNIEYKQAFNIKFANKTNDNNVTLDSQIVKQDSPNNKLKQLSIILDPPRKGCDKAVLASLISISIPHNLYYISCNPSTLTRDLASLTTSYQIKSITPYDMFPQTRHVEVLVCLSKE